MFFAERVRINPICLLFFMITYNYNHPSNFACTPKTMSTKHFLTYVSSFIRSIAVNRDYSAALTDLFWMYLRNSLSYGTFISALNLDTHTRIYRFVRCPLPTRIEYRQTDLYP